MLTIKQYFSYSVNRKFKELWDPMKEKIERLENFFKKLKTADEKYLAIIEKGRKLGPFEEAWKTAENRVSGCQSTLYLHSELVDGKLFLHATADALISMGFAAILLEIYSGEPVVKILETPPDFLKNGVIFASLSPNRSNGLFSLYQEIILRALKGRPAS